MTTHIGVAFPQTEMKADNAAIRAFGEGVERSGFHHILSYDHVLGADPAVHEGWKGTYTVKDAFHEPIVLLSFFAALTELELVTGVLVAPQRQTALVAKQAAQLDVVSGGRLRLGIGIGTNPVEYEGLGQDFRTRGRRLDQQADLLRRLWTEESVSYAGDFDRVTGAGLTILPIQRPIPLWFGGRSPAAYARIGALADGWFPLPGTSPGPAHDEARKMVADAAVAAGRDPEAIGMDATLIWKGSAATLAEEAEDWRRAGATHLTVSTTGSGLKDVEDHLAALESAADGLGLQGPV